MKKLLDGRAGVITGGTSGIGEAAVGIFAEEGAKIVFCGRDEEAGKRIEAAQQAKGYEVYFYKCDVTKEEEVKALIEYTVSKFGTLQWAFNNAGKTGSEPVDVHETHTDSFQSMMDTNFWSVYYGMKYEAPYMLQAGGAIVNTCSINSISSAKHGLSYGASKFAAYAITQVAALDYARQNIRVNAVGPGVTDTPMIAKAKAAQPEHMAKLIDSIPDGRLGDPSEIANAALFLLSDMSTHVTGQLLLVDGGLSVKM